MLESINLLCGIFLFIKYMRNYTILTFYAEKVWNANLKQRVWVQSAFAQYALIKLHFMQLSLTNIDPNSLSIHKHLINGFSFVTNGKKSFCNTKGKCCTFPLKSMYSFCRNLNWMKDVFFLVFNISICSRPPTHFSHPTHASHFWNARPLNLGQLAYGNSFLIKQQSPIATHLFPLKQMSSHKAGKWRGRWNTGKTRSAQKRMSTIHQPIQLNQ